MRKGYFFHKQLPVDPTADSGLHTSHEMTRILKRERDLAARFEGCFSMLVLTAQDSRSPWSTWTPLIPAMRRRLRSSDEVGWLDDRHMQIGVVMHRTPAKDAWCVADDLLAAIPPIAPHPTCEVRYFPSEASHEDRLPREESMPKLDGARPVLPMERLFVVKLPLSKRCLDIVLAGTALLLLSPLLLLIAAAVKLTSSGPVIYSQPRRGMGGRCFVIHKFRSMTVGSDQKQAWLLSFNEQDGPAFKMKNDPRVTTIGQFLRKTSLDELPQLWNVLVGDMSLVGPRPLICPESDACSPWQRMRLDVTPGITGVWQLYGDRDNFDEWMRMDIRYVHSRSLWLDLKLLMNTLPVVVFGRRAGF